MWLTFGFAVLIAVLVLYVPGYLVGRGLRLDRFASVAVAPAFSVFALVALGVVFFAVGITCSAWVLLLACVVLCLLVFAVCGSVRRAKGGTACSNPSALGDVRFQVALYVGVAVFVAVLVFLHAMGDPASFSRNDDTTVHLSVVRGFLDSGTYSTLNVTKYLDLGEAGGYYPAAWHVVTAVVASFVGNEVALATNAMILVTCTVVLPLGVLCLMRALFPDNKLVVCGGSLFSAAFCGFPWGFVVYGQLLSNLFSFAMIPAALGVLICGLAGKGCLSKCAWIAAYACSLVAVALAQPNGAFTLGVWSVLFAVSYLWDRESSASRWGKATAVVLLLVACAAWVVLFLAPPLQSVVTYSWKSTLSIPKAVVSGLLFMFTSRACVLRYRRFHRRLRQAVADGLLVHRLLPHRRHDGAVRHPACRAGLRLAGGAWLAAGWARASCVRERSPSFGDCRGCCGCRPDGVPVRSRAFHVRQHRCSARAYEDSQRGERPLFVEQGAYVRRGRVREERHVDCGPRLRDQPSSRWQLLGLWRGGREHVL